MGITKLQAEHISVADAHPYAIIRSAFPNHSSWPRPREQYPSNAHLHSRLSNHLQFPQLIHPIHHVSSLYRITIIHSHENSPSRWLLLRPCQHVLILDLVRQRHGLCRWGSSVCRCGRGGRVYGYKFEHGGQELGVGAGSRGGVAEGGR